jgi:hypothetical protein
MLSKYTFSDLVLFPSSDSFLMFRTLAKTGKIKARAIITWKKARPRYALDHQYFDSRSFYMYIIFNKLACIQAASIIPISRKIPFDFLIFVKKKLNKSLKKKKKMKMKEGYKCGC